MNSVIQRSTARWVRSRGARRWGLLIAIAITAVATPAAGASQAIQILTLSNRADLISGGRALVQVRVPAGVRLASLRITLGRRNATKDFALRPNGRFEGLVTGLPIGQSVLRAVLPDGTGAALTITNHPIVGPVFSGPRLEPWPCAAGAIDRTCDHPTTYAYGYQSKSHPGTFAPYDPAHPAADVAMTKTDSGRTVPFIVRVETGTEDRDQYKIAVLYDPRRAWRPWAPQVGWNGKLEITHGEGCGAHHGDVSGMGVDFTPNVLDSQALGLGFAVLSTALDNASHSCNVALEAESLSMAKEHLIDSYGPIRYTIGTGCSGGSLAENQIANAYPGIYQGLVMTCTFYDAVSSGMDAEDCALAERYWEHPSGWRSGVTWTLAQEDAAMGKRSPLICNSWANQYPFWEGLNPRLAAGGLDLQNCGISLSQAFDPISNPHGVRCTLQDAAVNVFGRRPDGYANRPLDNVGVQYGLRALEARTISPAQFVDLNTKIGSHDINYDWQAKRVAADAPSLARAYRSGAVNEANNLADVAIIDQPSGNVDIHEEYHAFAYRARMRRAYGTDGNHVIWYGLNPNFPDALLAMNRWLSAVSTDHRHRTPAAKVADDRPASVHDICSINGVVDPGGRANCHRIAGPGTGTRGAAGGSLRTDIIKCQLEPLRRSDYPGIQFTDAEFSALQHTFPAGVCDWTKPGVGQQPAVAWQTYQSGPGGRPLGPPPVSRIIP